MRFPSFLLHSAVWISTDKSQQELHKAAVRKPETSVSAWRAYYAAKSVASRLKEFAPVWIKSLLPSVVQGCLQHHRPWMRQRIVY